MRFLIASVALFSAGAAVAAPTGQVRTFHDGNSVYHYTTTKNADGTVTLAGEEAYSRTPFTFTVRGARVDGKVNGQPVAFAVPRRTALALHEQVGD